jgi:hypothetical protein
VPRIQLGLAGDRAKRGVKSSPDRVITAGAFLIIGAVSFPAITLCTWLFGYSIWTSLLLGLAFASPVSVAICVLLWAIQTMFRSE